VEDKGIGITESTQQRLFQPSKGSVNGLAMNPNGNRHGLFICQRVLEHLEGRIWFEHSNVAGNDEGKEPGTKVVFAFKLLEDPYFG
jgi:signal transduction histidine kinase